MDQENELEIKDLVERVSDLTGDLLSEGADNGELVFALTSVAAAMGLQVNHDPLATVHAMTMAIVIQTGIRLEITETDDDVNDAINEANEDTEIPSGATVH